MSQDEQLLKANFAAIRSRLELLKAKKISGGYNRYPSGSTKGGQFAPKGTGGGAGGSEPNTFHDVGYPGGGMWAKPSGPPPGAKPHPAGVNDKGQPVSIDKPTTPSPSSTWKNPGQTATFIPGGKAPENLNGVPMKSWSPPKDGWAKVGGNNESLERGFPFTPTANKSIGAGVLIVEPDGRVWLTKPTNEFGGYKQTYPKGTVESGLTMQQNAIKEAYEETGLKIKITGVLGDYERTTSRARMYIAQRVGGTPREMGWESQAVRLSTLKDARQLLNMSHDKAILDDLTELMDIGKAKGGAKAGSWQNQARWPAGSPLGGQWKATGRDGITMPPKIAGGLEGKNAVYQKAANAAHASAQGGDSSAALALMDKYGAKGAQYSSGIKSSSHVKWGAQVNQYAGQLVADVQNKIKATASADAIAGPEKLSKLMYSSAKPGGSNPGAVYVDANGEKWLVKGSNAATGQDAKTVEDRSKNEVLAAKLMLAAGAGAPEMKLVDLEGQHNGGLGVASKMIDGITKIATTSPSHMGAARADFAVHAWLANYDALGMGLDNTVLKDGKAVNIDTGGALLFRAQGAKKGAEHGVNKGVLDPTAPEFESMRTTSAEQKAVYGKMTASDLKHSAEKLQNVSNETITKLVNTYGPGTAAEKAALAENLIARKNAVLDKAGLPFSMAAGVSVAAPAATSKPKIEQASLDAAKASATAPAKGMVQLALAAEKASKAAANYDARALGAAIKDMAPHVAKAPEMPKLGATPNSMHTLLTQATSALLAGDKPAVLAAAITSADMAKLTNSSIIKADALKVAAFSTMAAAHLQNQEDKAAAVLAAGATPKVDIPAKPTFGGIGVGGALSPAQNKAASYYKELADKAEALHKAGDIEGLKALTTKKGGKPAWPVETKNGQMMSAYHASLVVDLDKKGAAGVVAAAQAAEKAVAPKLAVSPSSAPMPAFENYKLPSTNSNAASHNAKVETIEKLAKDGDAKGLLALNYGTNTYGKQQAKLANDALVSLGSPHAVTPGQKKNENPALFGGVTAQQATGAAAKVNTAPNPPHPATKAPVDLTKLDMSKTAEPSMPTFDKSSKAWVNEQNNKLAQEVKAAFLNGNLPKLQGMTYDTVDKETGKVTGKASLTEHPAKDLKAFYDAAVAQMRDVAYPPQPLKHFDAQRAKSIADVSNAFPPKPFGTTVSKVKANEKVGFWIALGKVSDTEKLMPKKTQAVSDADVKKAFSDFKKAPPLVKSFIEQMQASGSYATLYRSGKKEDGQGNSLKETAKAALAYAQSKPEGTKVYRWQQMPTDMVSKMLSSGPGTVIQADGPMPTSYSETATSGFGPHKFTILFSAGAKAVDSHGSTKFEKEKEITMLPNSRFVVHTVKKLPSGKLDVVLILLPPDLGIPG